MALQILIPPDNSASVIEWAQWFATAFDAKIFPVKGKVPLVRSWKENANKKTTVFDWSEATGYGVLLDDMVVVDFDSREVDLLAETLPWLTETLTVQTSRGWHIYYKGKIHKKFSFRPEVPIDILHGGLVVGPGSLHEESSIATGSKVYYNIDWSISSLILSKVPKELVHLSSETNTEYKYDNPNQELKDKIPLAYLYTYYGGLTDIDSNAQGEHLVRCIMPNHEDRNPSMSLNNDKGFFICHSCDAKGDQISLIKLMENMSDVQAFNKFREMAGIKYPVADWMVVAPGDKTWGNKLSNLTPKHPEHIEEQFDLWNSLDVLKFIYDTSQEALIAPQALLGACLTMAAASIGPSWMLPSLRGRGNPSPLSLHIAIVGQAGSGKTSIKTVLRESFLWPDLPLTKIAMVWRDDGYNFQSRGGKAPPTSPGFRGAFGDRPKDSRNKPRQHTRAGLWFYYDEAAQLIEGIGAKDYNLKSVLRTAWSGSNLTSLTATDELQSDIPDYSYGYGLLTNAHIETSAHRLFDTSSGEGDGDRWIGFSAHDPLIDYENAVPQEEPWPLHGWDKSKAEPIILNKDNSMISPDRYKVEIDYHIRKEIVALQVEQRRGNIDINPLEGQHFNLIRLRISALLAYLNNMPPVITPRLWTVAGSILTLSTQVRELAWRAHIHGETKEVIKQAANKVNLIEAGKMIEEKRETIIAIVARRIAAELHRKKGTVLRRSDLTKSVGADYARWRDLGGDSNTLRDKAFIYASNKGWIERAVDKADEYRTSEIWRAGSVIPPDRIGSLLPPVALET